MMRRRILITVSGLLLAVTLTTPVQAQTSSKMTDAVTLEQLTTAEDFYAEYANVLRLYQAFFDRQPDVGGAKYWIRLYRQAYEIEEIASSFAASAEFKNTYGATTNEQFVATVYNNVLGRGADGPGFNYWLDLLNSGQLNRGGTVRWIAAGNEFVGANRFVGELSASPGADRGMRVTGINSFVGTDDFRNYSSSNTGAWATYTKAKPITIPSTLDSYQQPAYWAPSDGEQRPLLLVLHSWSSNYTQQLNIPFARWADENDWAMIAPNFRGANNNPEATGSVKTTQDIKDAVNFALANDSIDPTKVFMIGFSGGAMASLNMAGRAPEMFAGAVAWVPVYNMVDFYLHRLTVPRRHYRSQLINSCGGEPLPGTAAGDECFRRSPINTIANAKASGLPIYIGAGIRDALVGTSAGFKAFDALAAPEDQFGPDVYTAVDNNVVPASIRGTYSGDAWFDGQDPPLLMSRESGNVTLVLFEGKHESLYEPGLEWMARTAWIAER